MLPLAFRPPAPHEHEIRCSSLYITETQTRANKPKISVLKHRDCYQVNIIGEEGAVIRYTVDNSLPSVFSGKVYSQPFFVPIEAECSIKALTVLCGHKESEIAVLAPRDMFSMPEPVEMKAERPDPGITARAPLLFDVEISPYSSSRPSSDDENEYSSPYLTFPR